MKWEVDEAEGRNGNKPIVQPVTMTTISVFRKYMDSESKDNCQSKKMVVTLLQRWYSIIKR